MNRLLLLLVAFLMAVASATSFTKSPQVEDIEQYTFPFFGKRSSSSGPSELFHITDSPKNLVNNARTFAPGAFTYKWTVSPHRRTFSPLDLNASKKPHGTKPPTVQEKLSHHGGVTFPSGAFTQKFTIPPLGKITFAPVELNKHASRGTKSPPSPQKDIYTWAPIQLASVSKKPRGTNPPASN